MASLGKDPEINVNSSERRLHLVQFQSIVSLQGSKEASSCRNCWHTPATWDLALFCIRRNPKPTAPAYGFTTGLKISSWYPMVVRLPLESTWRAVQTSKQIPPYTTAKSVILKDVAGSSLQCLQTLSHLSHLLSVNLLWSVKSMFGKFVAILTILVFFGKCRATCMVLSCEHNPNLWTSDPHTILKKLHCLCRHMHTWCLLKIILQGSGSAYPVPPSTKMEVVVLLLGPPCLRVYWPVSW